MKTRLFAIAAVAGLAAVANAQSIDLSVETNAALSDGILDVGETAGFTIRATGAASAGEAYRALGSLFGFSMGGFGDGTFTQTGVNSFLTGLPGSPGLVYDNSGGSISMLPTGGFVQLAGILPTDNANPVFLFSFDWTPSAFDGRVVNWTANATNGSIYEGGVDGQGGTWTNTNVSSIGGAAGTFRVVPAPASAALLGLGGLVAARRRRA